MDTEFLLVLALAGVIMGAAVCYAAQVFRRESRIRRGKLVKCRRGRPLVE